MNKINLFLSICALAIAIFSIFYTMRFNRYRVLISNARLVLQPENPYLITFDVFNNSPKAIIVNDLQLSFPSGKSLPLLPDHRTHIPDGWLPQTFEYEKAFQYETLIPPVTSESFGYYCEARINCIAVTVATNKRIHHLAKQQSITVHLVYDDQQDDI